MDVPTEDGNPDFPSLENLLCFAIYSTGHAYKQFYRTLLEDLGLTYPQYLVMAALWHKNDQTVKEIGKTLFLDSSTLTPLLKRLEVAGLLTRNRNPEDERQVRLRLTRQGAALQERSRPVREGIRQTVGLTEEEAKALLGVVTGIRNRLIATSPASSGKADSH